MKSEINKALEFYGLETPIKSRSDIKKRYRKLSMIHHPDKGGKEENFKLLGKYRNILEKNFYKLNKKYSNLKKEEENLKKQENKQKDFIQLAGYEAKKMKIKFKFSLNFIIEFLVYIIFFLPVFLIEITMLWLFIGFLHIYGYILFFLIYILLFFIPLFFYTDEHAIIFETTYYEQGIIMTGNETWTYEGHFLRNWGETIPYYKDNLLKSGTKIYGTEKLEERKTLIANNMEKGFLFYLLILVIYSITYYIFIKKYIKNGIDKYLRNKYLKYLRYTTIYYFILLYLLFFIITQLILLIY